MPTLGTTAGPFKFLPFVGGAISTGAGFAVGAATAPTLRPVLQDLENLTWAAHASRPLDADIAAGIVAEDVEQRDWGANEAVQGGIDGPRFDALLGEALNAPGIPQLFEAWRRDLISDAAFEHGLRKAKLEPRWDAPLKALKARLLTLSDLANARQQGFVDEGRQHSESQLQGLDAGRADILFQLSGLPLGVETMQQALNRGLVTRAEFDQAIREGHTKTKYTDLAESLRHPVLTAPEYATLHLKGWITGAEMNAGGALHGFTAEQMNLLYLARGRPAAPGQMATAAARGIDGPAGRPVDRAQFLTAIRQSDIRPEYGPMLWDARFLYPPLFQLTRLVQAGAIDADTAREWAVKDRYPPEVVNALHAYWSQGTAAKGDTHVGKAQTQLWSTLHRAYMAGDATDALVRQKLPQAGVSAVAVDGVIETWNHEREVQRQRITPAQVKKAYLKAVPNEATGAAWTYDDALAELLSRGWSHVDATTFLKTV
jgi:hypothetical protein